MTQLLRQKEVGREADAGVPYDRIVFVRRSQTKIKHGSALVSGEVDRRSAKMWGTKEKVSKLSIYQKQESRLTRILGNHFKPQYVGAI